MGQWTQEDVDRIRKQHGVMMPANIPAPKSSKWRNVRTQADGQNFDSKREADYWLELKMREKAGEIRELRRQVVYALYAPSLADPGVNVQVSEYRADYVYLDAETGAEHVVDAKGKRTREYLRSKKWLYLQSGIEIEEV